MLSVSTTSQMLTKWHRVSCHVCALYAFSEYYFSGDNLQRDFFLRRKMDSSGWIPISLVASFHRVQALTQDVQLIIHVSGGLLPMF